MDDIRQERPNEGPILKLNKRLNINVTKQKIWHTRQGIYGLSGKQYSIPRSKVTIEKPL